MNQKETSPVPKLFRSSRWLVKVIECVVLVGSLSACRGGEEGSVVPQEQTESFTRMFPELPPFAPATDESRERAKQLGEKGGPIDALDDLTDPIQSILNPGVFSPNNPDNPNMTAGITFIGQFLDHDLTLDLRSPLHAPSDPRKTRNFRTAAFDLDNLYGGGPVESPELYNRSSGDIKFRMDPLPGSEAVSRKGALRYDLPRDANQTAIIGDARNDENVIIAQFHLAMLRFHNAVIDRLRADPAYAGQSADRGFKEAQRLVRWHYQWIVVHEFLPLTIGQDRVEALLSGGLRFYKVDDPQGAPHLRNQRNQPLIPIEFSGAAYRFGHSQVRPSYRVNFGPDSGSPFFAFAFDDTIDPNATDPEDMRGGKRAARRFVDWQTFFDFGDGNVRNNKKIDSKLSSVLKNVVGSGMRIDLSSQAHRAIRSEYPLVMERRRGQAEEVSERSARAGANAVAPDLAEDLSRSDGVSAERAKGLSAVSVCG